MRALFASHPMEQSKAGYYADLILYPLLVMGLSAFETWNIHRMSIPLAMLPGSRIAHVDNCRVWSPSLHFAFC